MCPIDSDLTSHHIKKKDSLCVSPFSWSAGSDIAQLIEAIRFCYVIILVKVVIPDLKDGLTDCKVSIWLTIPRHSDSVTQKKRGFPVKPGFWANAGHPLSSYPPGKRSSVLCLPTLEAAAMAPWPQSFCLLLSECSGWKELPWTLNLANSILMTFSLEACPITPPD